MCFPGTYWRKRSCPLLGRSPFPFPFLYLVDRAQTASEQIRGGLNAAVSKWLKWPRVRNRQKSEARPRERRTTARAPSSTSALLSKSRRIPDCARGLCLRELEKPQTDQNLEIAKVRMRLFTERETIARVSSPTSGFLARSQNLDVHPAACGDWRLRDLAKP